MSTVPLHDITVPAAEPAAEKVWRKRLKALDETKVGGYVCLGDWLDAGAVYRLAVGALIVGVARVSETERRVRAWRVNTRGELTVVRDSTFKTFAAEFGESVRKTLRTALEKYPPTLAAPYLVQPAPPAPATANRFDGHCERCRGPVAAGAGLLGGQPGHRTIEHRPGECPPPPPLRNERGQKCAACGGWVEPGAGTLSSPVEGFWEVRHEGACPTAAERQAAPPVPRRTNQRADRCAHCGQEVAEFAGWLIPPAVAGGSWSVEHDGQCPAPAAGQDTDPTWQITAGVPSRYKPVPAAHWKLGAVARFEVREWEQPVPEDAPGLVRGRGLPSLIGVVVTEERPRYCRDEDGDAPCDDLIGSDGWFFSGRVRMATAEEAAPLLAEEGEAALVRGLRNRADRLLSWRYPREGAQLPAAEELAQELEGVELVELHTRPAGERRPLYGSVHRDQAWIAEGREWVMTTVHNGADGDDWLSSNHGRSIALLHPMTDELRALVADLTARYGVGDPS